MLRLDEIAVDTFVRKERIDAVARYSEALGLHEDYLRRADRPPRGVSVGDRRHEPAQRGERDQRAIDRLAGS